MSNSVVVMFHSAPPDAIIGALDAALVTDAELATGERGLLRGRDHLNPPTDPCVPSHRGDAREADPRPRPLAANSVGGHPFSTVVTTGE